MNGTVDDYGRALVVFDVRASEQAESIALTVWIDTAFTGELVIPRSVIQAMRLPQSAAVMAGLADGTEVVLESYSCLIDWVDGVRMVEVIESDGRFPLLGVGLLRDRRLEIDYRSRSLIVE